LRADADTDRINLAAAVVDGQQVAVPIRGQPLVAASGSGTAGTTDAEGPSRSSPINLNTASADDLESLPGVGPATAAAIIDHRDTVGPFAAVEDLLDVRGIGDAKFEQLRPLVTVGG
ncbi:MAG: ComEA family DNA-binding protein, partial [Actinomycetes bacterium]